MTRSAGRLASRVGALQCVPDRHAATKGRAMARDAVTVAAEQHYSDEGRWDGTSDVKLFDVTCVVGSVYHDPASKQSPREVAFALIAQHDACGVFSFPEEDGSRTVITVEHVPAIKGQ